MRIKILSTITAAALVGAVTIHASTPVRAQGASASRPRSLAGALAARPESNLALISTPGEFAAREARSAVLKEARGADGAPTLVPDERKRAAAQRDLEALRARILRELKTDAGEDGIPWPPGAGSLPSGKEDENDR